VGVNRLGLSTAAQLAQEALNAFGEAEKARAEGDTLMVIVRGQDAVTAYDNLADRGWLLYEPRSVDRQ
jgi:hypothetical protein